MLTDPVLLYVDLQNDYAKPGYAIDQQTDVSHTQSALEAAGEFLDRYRASGRTPVLVRTHHDELTNSSEWSEMYDARPYAGLCRPNTEGAEFVSELDVHDSDVLITKHRYSAFHNTPLETYLSANDVSRLLVGGVSTEICVESTVRDAFSRDYEVTVLSDCTAPTNPEDRERTLDRLGTYFGDVRPSSAINL
ncbi:MAG: isochorismatase family cysteine hydrolase [Haloarculaceae archaeon]